ncbi:dystrophin-like, partial [Oratosquilla oratoria]|uniref:dystrophin-like n=1 Tax=Oratosquilla oratoria TaxID=337810 RepID=UPI003F75A35E
MDEGVNEHGNYAKEMEAENSMSNLSSFARRTGEEWDDFIDIVYEASHPRSPVHGSENPEDIKGLPSDPHEPQTLPVSSVSPQEQEEPDKGSIVQEFLEDVRWQHDSLLGKMSRLREVLARHLGDSDEREDVQKKTFAKWINSQLAKGNHPLVTDLFYDLRDGTRLLGLLEVLTGSTYKREKGKMRVHHLNNVSRGLNILEQHNVKLVNISNDDIVDGSAKLTLGLVWSIILHWQVQGVLKDVMADLQQTNLEKTLLAWCRQTTKGYHGVDVRNFTTSWTDGLAFNALIHRHRPDLFDWPTVAKKLPFARLEQAFRLANKEFGIERLLDPEDVNTQVPDKKSMMMYIMCLFQALPKASFTMESLDVSIQSDSSFSLEASGGDEKNRPLSTVSIGLGGYQRTLEEVLTWLLGAEDRLAAMPPIAEEPEEVKQQFHQLEDLMLELTAKQGGIGDVLGEGTRLLKEGVMGEEEEEEVRVQMKLLNTRWEDLRVKAMDRQTQLHDCLMQLQQSQLENLKSWLTATEDRISKMSEVGPTTEDLKAQVVAHHKLQQDLEGEQANINSLSNMVVVVDEGNSDAAYSNLEDELNALGERWAHICRWAEQRWTTLQVLTVHWEQLEREMEKLGKWLDENEAQLKQMESNPSTDQEHLLRQAGTLQVLQSEMDIQQRRFALLQEESSKVLSNLPKDSPAQTKIPETLENLQDRWDCLVAIIEAQNQRLAASGIDIKRTDFPSETDGSVVSSSTSTITHEGATMITKVITTKTTTTKHVEEGSFKRQKLEGESYEEFNVALNQLGGWMDTVQERLQPKQTDDLSYEQLVQLCQHLQDEVQTQQEEYNKVMSLGQSAISETATIGECSSESESKVTDFAARWQALSEMMANLQSRIEFMAERKKLTAELSAMEIHYQGFQRWFDNVRTVSENEPNAITSQVEQCKTKIAGMKSHEQRLNEMNQTVSNLSSKWPIDAAAIVHSGKEFIEKWEALLLKFVDWGNALSSELEKQPPQSYLEALTALKRWLANVEAAVTTEPLVISKLPVLSDQLQNYKELLKTVEVEESSLAYINRTGNELLSRSEVNIRLKGDLVELNKRWESAVAALKSRVENVEKAIEMLGQYRDEVSGLKSWLAEVDVFLHAEDAALGDIETLEAQLEQSNALQDDISTLETNVNNIKTTSGHIIQETNDEELRNEVSQQVKDLSDRWDVVLDLARRQNKSLKDALAKSQKVHEDISKLNMWLDKLELEFPPVKPIETSSELSSVIGAISKLREDIANHTDTFRSVNEIGNEMLQYENVTSHDDMARQFTLLNGRWTDIISQIDRRHKTLTKATEQYAQFQVLCEEETSWLDQLEQKLEKSSKSAADAEEISEALDDLEIFLHGHHEERLQKVQELAEQLVQEGVMTFAVQNSTHDLTSRFNSLNAQANEQRTTLEGGVQEAQAWEREYISVLEWLTHTDVVITQAVADPSTHLEGTDEVLKELTRQQEVLAKMEAQVQVYQTSGKLEAAQRLEDQVVHLKKKYEEVQGKLQQLNSAPSDFDVRLKTMDAQLHDISENVQLVSLTAGNPTAIQDQLNLCLQLYRTLSEVKGEVESVIATGRKIVKENQTSNPEGLTQQLDQLKALYNELGKAVTEQRGILEQSLRQSKKILKDGQHLEDWLSTTEHELDTREATLPLRSVQHELHFAQSEQDQKKDEMEKFIVGLGEVKGWLEVTENKLSNLTKYPAEERANIIKKVSQEVQDYKGQIESIRDTSVELISHGELFESRVQPELVTINQRWEHIFKTVTKQEAETAVPDMKVETHKEMKQKDSSLPSTSKVVTHVMTKTTITTTSTSSSSSSQVARPDEDQVDIYLREVSSMSDRITALKYKTKDIPHFNEAKEKVEGLEHEVALLEPDIATVISRGDTLTLTTHMVDVPRANSIRLAVNDLRQQWSTLKADTEHLKNETDLVNQEIENYPERVDVL